MKAFRLKSGQDLKISMSEFVVESGFTSASVVSAVGSLNKINIRMAGAKPDKQEAINVEDYFEVVSLIGTIAQNGESHLHIAVSDKNGKVIGGHLKEGCIVHTTAEIVLITDPSLQFTRTKDESTGFKELNIEELNNGR